MWQRILGAKLNAGFVLRSFCLGAGISLTHNVVRVNWRISKLTQELKILEEQEESDRQPDGNRDPREYFARNPGEAFYERIETVRSELAALHNSFLFLGYEKAKQVVNLSSNKDNRFTR